MAEFTIPQGYLEAEKDREIERLREMYAKAHKRNVLQGEWHDLIHELAEHYRVENARLREQYNELLFAVVMKHPGETRHQTALRYIQQAERPTEADVSQQACDHTPQAPGTEP